MAATSRVTEREGNNNARKPLERARGRGELNMRASTYQMRRMARELGYNIVRGSYAGTSDDRIDRWYIEPVGTDTVDRRGSGFGTIADAVEYLTGGLLE